MQSDKVSCGLTSPRFIVFGNHGCCVLQAKEEKDYPHCYQHKVQLQSHLDWFNIGDKFQSGFKPHHSTESALLKVHNDIALALDAKQPVILALVDLSAAFDTIDHTGLISRLEHYAGLKGPALSWFTSFLTNRTFSVTIGECSSTVAPLNSGVPQGLILAPLLFFLYTLPLGPIILRHNVHFHFHFYADDVRIYMPLTQCDSNALAPLFNCIRNVKLWLAQNFLHLNESKTEYIAFSPDLTTLRPKLGALTPSVTDTVKNLGVIFDSSFNFDKQLLSFEDASKSETLLVSCRLRKSNSRFYYVQT
uniref:Reverse transcriptase domain-containing protein n=1 Tax=Monopterus albus TaxID=43700 RepID=A0A3Q3IEH9_MONAL